MLRSLIRTESIWFNSKIVHPKITEGECASMPNNNSSNNLLVPGVQQALDQMKYEIANEFGVNLGAETTSRANGSVGGEITKRLVQMAEQQLGGYPQQ
jgi:small acid-soluble spore protein B (major beta-type SASP)